MNCDKVKFKLSEYIDKSLSDSEHKEIENHLNQCAGCSQETAELFMSIKAMSYVQNKEPVIDLWSDFLAKTDAENFSFNSKSSQTNLLVAISNNLKVGWKIFISIIVYSFNKKYLRANKA